ncbi:MAG: hypothetical protein AAGA96_09795 [Verrucomicrobiota bacterium]
MKPKCIVTFDESLPPDIVDSLKKFAAKLKPSFEFSFEFAPNVVRLVSASIVAPDGAVGSIDGDQSKARQAQLDEILKGLQSELRRIL